MSLMSCDNCGKPATIHCADCKAVYYCGQDCQMEDFKEHSETCVPLAEGFYQVATMKRKGRGLVATAELPENYELFSEEPILNTANNKENCVVCGNRLGPSHKECRCGYRCCRKFLCDGQHRKECFLVSRLTNILDAAGKDAVKTYKDICLRLIRVVLLRRSGTAPWRQFANLQSALNDFKKHHSGAEEFLNFVMSTIRKLFRQMGLEIEKSELGFYYGVLELNAFSDSDCFSLYPTISLINHSCVPNSEVVFDAHPAQATLRTLRPVKKGEEIIIDYLCDQSLRLHERRRKLKEKFYFDCTCQFCMRALDPSRASKSAARSARLYKDDFYDKDRERRKTRRSKTASKRNEKPRGKPGSKSKSRIFRGGPDGLSPRED